MDAVPPEPEDAPERAADRVDYAGEVLFRCGNRRASVKATNISVTGARISGVYLVREGDRFYLKFGSLEAIEAEVAWCEDFAFGCKFVQPLHPAVLARIAAG